MFFLAILISVVGAPSLTLAADVTLLEATATEVLNLFETTDLTPRTYLQNLINHTNDNDDLINAFTTFNPQRVLSQARTKQEYRQRQQCLYGLPIAVKDNINVVGYPVTAGTPGLLNNLPKRSSPVIRSLVSAGAIIFAKANMHELQFGITNNNGYFGPVRNPWNESLISGGSSGGSVASVSARFTPIALCADTIASCRLPAALTGVVGYRPSIGRYSAKRVLPTSPSLDTIGINARTVEDVVLIDGVINNGSCDQRPTPRTLSTIRLGFDRETFLANVDPDLLEVFNAAVETLTNAGVQIIPINISQVLALDLEHTPSIYFHEWFHTLRVRLSANYRTRVSLRSVLDQVVSPDVQGAINGIRDGTLAVSDDVYNEVVNVFRPRIQVLVQNLFDDFSLDGIIFPTTRLTARPIGQDPVIINGQSEPAFGAYISFVSFGAAASVPGISIPIGLTQETRLPVGMEIEGAYGKDRELLDVAATLFDLFEPLPRPPDVNF